MTEKDKKIIEDSEREGIPIFVFTAKDTLSVNALAEYYQVCMKEKCTPDHITGIATRIGEFRQWQLRNKSQVKLPD
jgi:hypothetical protein